MGGMNLIEMWGTMGTVAKAVAFVLVFMSMWSFGVAIERLYTFNQARKQSKLYAPQVAKHLKEGRLKDAVAVSQSKTYQYSHLAKVVLAGLQEYQFQQEAGGTGLNRDDVLDTVRRSIQRATALTANDLVDAAQVEPMSRALEADIEFLTVEREAKLKAEGKLPAKEGQSPVPR